jgi:glycosyltransferase 2 family protein
VSIRIRRLAESRSIRLAVRFVAVVLLVLLALRFRQLWRQQHVDFSNAHVSLLVLAAVLSLVAVVSYGWVWPVILREIGGPVPRGSVRIFLQSQLGKYLPGSVWQYAGRVGLARAHGVPVRTALLSLGIEVGASAIAAVAVGLFVLPLVAALPLALALGGLVFLVTTKGARVAEVVLGLVARIAPITSSELRPALRALPRMVLLYVPVWGLYGLAFWLTARALFPISAGDLVFFVAAFALGWLVGMAAVFAPGGIGVREAVLVGLLAPTVGQREAIVIAAASRLLLTAADLVAGGASILVPRIAPRGMGAAAE